MSEILWLALGRNMLILLVIVVLNPASGELAGLEGFHEDCRRGEDFCKYLTSRWRLPTRTRRGGTRARWSSPPGGIAGGLEPGHPPAQGGHGGSHRQARRHRAQRPQDPAGQGEGEVGRAEQDSRMQSCLLDFLFLKPVFLEFLFSEPWLVRNQEFPAGNRKNGKQDWIRESCSLCTLLKNIFTLPLTQWHWAGMSGNDFCEFGNGNGNQKYCSQLSGTGTGIRNTVPNIREWEQE